MFNYPRVIIEKWEISYQLDCSGDDSRIFLINYDNMIEMKISTDCYFKELQDLALPYDLHKKLNVESHSASWIKFIEEVRKHDVYLDILE